MTPFWGPISACTSVCVGSHSVPPTLPGTLRERRFLCPFVSSWGSPEPPWVSTAARGIQTGSLGPPRPLPCGWGPVLDLSRAGGWRGLRGVQGAVADAEVGWRGLTALGPPPSPGWP